MFQVAKGYRKAGCSRSVEFVTCERKISGIWARFVVVEIMRLPWLGPANTSSMDLPASAALTTDGKGTRSVPGSPKRLCGMGRLGNASGLPSIYDDCSETCRNIRFGHF